MKRKTLTWFFVIPAILYLFIINLFPLLWALGLSFFKYNLLTERTPKFVGVDNYGQLFNDPNVWLRMQITGKFILISLPLQFILGTLIAFLLYTELYGRRLLLTLFLIPLLIAPVASALFFRFLLDANFGLVNWVLSELFGWKIYWLGSEKVPILGVEYALLTVALVETWIWTPFITLMVTAGLSTIPKSVLEQASIDNISLLDKFRYIVFPYIKPILGLALILRAMDAFKTFDTIYVLTAGGPGVSTEIITFYIYKLAFQGWDFGSASALSFGILVIILYLTTIFLDYFIFKGEEE